MRTKQEQIEEIKQVLIKTCKRCRPFEEDYMQSRYAEALYNAGYRKTFTSDLASNTQKVFKEGYIKGSIDRMIETNERTNEVRKETAKKILDYFDRYAGTGKKLIGNMISEQRKKYGVEVEE